MPFIRNWDETCPRVWNSWEANGTSWIVQDIRPEDDDLCVDIIFEHFVPDEPVCSTAGVLKDPESVASLKSFWLGALAQRFSLGCYKVENGTKTLVALNACIVKCLGENELEEAVNQLRGQAAKDVIEVLGYTEEKTDSFKSLGVDKLLYGAGLVVKREYRGAKLGSRILNAREPLCRHLGIKGTSTLFTGPASQKSAKLSGFTTERVFTHKEFKEHGFTGYTDDETKVMKVMIKKYE